MRRRLRTVFVLVSAFVMAMALSIGTASAHDLVDGGVPGGPSCTGEQISNHARGGGGPGYKASAMNDHGMTVKVNILDFVLPDCETGNH